MATNTSLKSTTVGAKLSIVAAVIALVGCVFYLVNAPAANVFDGTVVAVLLLGAICAAAYALAPTDYVDILSLVAVVLFAIGLLQVAIGSIATFADVLSGITMFGSTGGIEWVVTDLVIIAVAMVTEQVSCFMRRRA